MTTEFIDWAKNNCYVDQINFIEPSLIKSCQIGSRKYCDDMIRWNNSIQSCDRENLEFECKYVRNS